MKAASTLSIGVAAMLSSAEASFQFPGACSSAHQETLSGASGTISVSSYGNNEHRCWHVDCSNGAVSMTLNSVNLEEGYDFVSMSKVANSAVGSNVFTESTMPSGGGSYGFVTGSGGGAFVELTSDHSVQGTGFTASWTCEENPCNLVDCPSDKSVCVVEENGSAVCRAITFPSECTSSVTVEGASGSVDSHSGNYGNNEVACLLVHCPNGKTELTWTAFNTEAGYDLVSAFPVSGGIVEETAALDQHSGVTPPSNTVVVGKDGIFVKLVSDYSVTRAGYEFDYTCAPILALGEVCYQFCEDGSCLPINKNDQCGADAECHSSTPFHHFNSHKTCQLKMGSVCYQFCEDGSCEFVDQREKCVLGTECKSTSTGPSIPNPVSTCQEVLPLGEVCYQFCEDGSCLPINKRDMCASGTVCKGDGTIGFNSHDTCQTPTCADLYSTPTDCQRANCPDQTDKQCVWGDSGCECNTN